ncbi:hypothetical protein CRG98_040221, partial [Punica granatum]
MPASSSSSFFLLLCLLSSFSVMISGYGEQLILVNNCNESIWPGMLGGAGHPTPNAGGFLLTSGQEVVIDLPQKWSGR